MKFLRSVCILFLLCVFYGPAFGIPKSGLYFYSHDHNIDQRTSLVLNDNASYKLSLQEEFKLEFDVYIRAQKIKFGYIFRIISNKEENFDFIVNNENKGFIVINNQGFSLNNRFIPDQWNHVEILFLRSENNIQFRFNEEILDCPYDLSQTKLLLVNFGLCGLKGFLAHDVAPFILKDVRTSSQNKEIHYWPLGKHYENISYDELKETPAIAQNPYWLMDNSIHWKKEVEFTSTTFPQVTFDSIHNQILVQSGDQLISYSLLKDTLEYTNVHNEVLMDQFYNRLIYNPLTDDLFYYGFNNKNIAYYDPVNKIWNSYPERTEEGTHAHHNRYISPADSMLYLFGGYGYYKYNSDFFKVNPKTNEWTAMDFSHTIMPRYLAAMGGNSTGDKIYIFGGRGAEMGRQELSPKNFSDLYEVDLKTNKVKFLFELEGSERSEYIYSNSLIVDDKSNSLYLLAYSNNKYSTKAILKRIDLKTHAMEALADSIDFYFKDVGSFCDLYYSPSLNKLIALLSYSDDQNVSTVQVYTLDFPPLNQSDVIQGKKATEFPAFLYILFVILFLVPILFFVFKWIGRDKNTQDKDLFNSETDSSLLSSEKERKFYEMRKRSILFLGGFQVFDKEGKNITGEFTPTLKYILVLIILYTLKNNKGISSSKLQEFLWFDKSEEAARNNRSVNLRKLRVLLQEIGNLDISSQNGYWYIFLPENVFSDYKEALSLIDKLQGSSDEEDVLRLLEILSFGNMLPNIQFEWIDNFKTDFSNAVIDVLLRIINSKSLYANNSNMRLRIADEILRIDPINEEAIAIKCNILYEMGKKGLAKAAFDNFAKEYRSLLGEPYYGSIKNFLEGER